MNTSETVTNAIRGIKKASSYGIKSSDTQRYRLNTIPRGPPNASGNGRRFHILIGDKSVCGLHYVTPPLYCKRIEQSVDIVGKVTVENLMSALNRHNPNKYCVTCIKLSRGMESRTAR